MKKLNRLLLLILLNSSFFTACQHEDVDSLTSDHPQPFTFKGLSVVHTYNTPTGVLTYELADFQQFFENNDRKARDASAIVYPSISTLSDLIETHTKKYPDTDRMNGKDIALISEHFAMSKQEIAEHIDTIEEYYLRNLQYDIIQSLLTIRESNDAYTNTKSQYYPGGLCKDEFWVVFGRLKAIDAVEDASERAIAFTNELYPGMSHYQNQADAFRHAVWNTLIAKYYAQKKRDIAKGIELAKDFTSAHEDCNDAEGAPVYDVEMDLHNNELGRHYFSSVASVRKRKGLFRRDEIIAPSDNAIRDVLKLRADNGSKVAKDVGSVNSVDIDRLVYFK